MEIELFFVQDKGQAFGVQAFFQEPRRFRDMWFSEGPYLVIFPKDLPDGKVKEKILALTWKDEPYRCTVKLSITSYSHGNAKK